VNAVELHDATVVRGEQTIFSGLSLQVGEHERVAVRGPNGCGKSTLLDVLLGLRALRKGTVTVLGQPPPSPEVGFVPQDPGASLLPWLSVRDNVALPLRLLGAPRHSIETAVCEVRDRLDPQHSLPLSLRPAQLSVGQRQLAALLRALIARPRLLLCDEPFSALDAASRAHLREVLARTTGGASGPALVFVTHDPDDLAELAERSILLTRERATTSSASTASAP
jgi:NitT/TauT family transport system ATP-binding protein